MKMIATAIVTLFAAAALAQGTAAPTATPAAPTAPAAATATAPATAKGTMEAKKDDMCAGKTGKAKTHCEAKMKKAHKE